MEVFMRSISYTTTEHQLTRELATVLHSREFMRFSSGLPLNFNVALKRKAKGSRGPHTGIGFLTLPTEQVGRYFLSYYAGPAPLRRITTGNRTIMFAPGKSAPRPYILEQIRRMPYRDPLAIEAQEKVTEEYESNAPRISVLQFGWECRDVNPVFSAEYEVVCPGHGFIKFQDEPREIRIRVTDADPTQEVKIVAIALNQIESLSIGNIGAQPAIFFSLSRPPAYETEVSPLIAELRQISLANSAVSLNTPSRQRHSAFDEAHIGTAMYTSHAIRVLCASNADLQTFRSLCITAGLKNWIIDQVPHVERRQLFSQRVRDQFADWIKELDWTVAFQLEAITKRLYLDLTEMLALRYPIEAFTATYGPRKTSGLLRWFSSEVRELFAYDNEGDGESVLGCFERCRKDFLKNPGQPARVARSTDDIFDCYHIQVTPTKYVLQGPFPERQNRVVRKYINHSQCFIRVSFVDENTLLYRFDRDMDGPDFIRKRVGSTLTNFVIGGQKIEFLAYSQSALKEHSVWFVRPFFDDKLGHIINAKRIIDDLGNFHDLAYDRTMGHCPARYAARIAQSFTATDSSVTIEAEEVLFIKDIERKDSNGRKSCFTDGVGTISPELARSIRHALYNKARRRRKPLAKPTAFQIRFMGAKGMLSVDHTLRGSEICIRDSMVKFDAPHANTIEIAQAFDRPSRYYLNRPLIMLLEGLGVSYEIFQEYQDTAVKHAQDATHDLSRTARLLEGHGLGGSFRLPSVLQRLHDLGVHLVPGQFYQIMQEFAVHHVLREMKHKARIPVPGGWIVVGVADVHRYLQPREIFACIRCPDCRRDIYIEGPTLVSRSPTIHPGDVQILHAIGRPPNDSPFARQPLKNTIVFSTEGTRSIPSFLGGGDLDGDTYNVWSKSCNCRCTTQWDFDQLSLLPPKGNQIPADYNPAEKKLTEHPCTMEDVKKFFIDYISSDVLGLVATNWLLIADASPHNIFDPKCFQLAQLHSDAVDYPKSGNPVDLRKIPKPDMKVKPDWHAPETISDLSGKYYESMRAIGRLSRAITLPALTIVNQEIRRRRWNREQDGVERSIEQLTEDLNYTGPTANHFERIPMLVERYIRDELGYNPMAMATQNQVQAAWDLFQTYAGQAHGICSSHTLSQAKDAMLMEQEILIGTIVAKSSQARRRHDLMAKMREVTTVLVRDIRDELKGDENSTLDDWLRRSYIAWKLSMLAIEDEVYGAQSFWWVSLGAVFDAVRAIKTEEEGNDWV